MSIVETERLVIREMDSAIDAEFIFALLNTPKFIEYIGDRGVRSVGQASDFIENRYRQSYRDHGFGLYLVELQGSDIKADTLPNRGVSVRASTPVGICGFVKRDHFQFPDIGFAFLPEFEGKGYGFESANAMLQFGRDALGFSRVLAITSLNNEVSGKLLEKLGFEFERLATMPDGEELKLFSKIL